MEKRNLAMKFLPWLLIILGFLTLDMFQGYFALSCILIAVVMFIERKWPEKLDCNKEDSNTAVKQQL